MQKYISPNFHKHFWKFKEKQSYCNKSFDRESKQICKIKDENFLFALGEKIGYLHSHLNINH